MQETIVPHKLKAIYIWNAGGLLILIPNRKGTKYLKVPYGHHPVESLKNIEVQFNIDAFGLEGYLIFEFGYIDSYKMAAIVEKIMPILMKHYGFYEYEENNVSFWDLLKKTIESKT